MELALLLLFCFGLPALNSKGSDRGFRIIGNLFIWFLLILLCV